MSDMKWWLLGLVVIGLVLAFVLVTRKAGGGAHEAGKMAANAAAAKATAVKVADKVERVADKVEAKVEKAAETAGAKVATAAAKVDAKVGAKVDKAQKAAGTRIRQVLEHDSHGAGSIRVTSRFAAPEGYTVKGDKETVEYYTVNSPDYGNVRAEVWFVDEGAAKAAGFKAAS